MKVFKKIFVSLMSLSLVFLTAGTNVFALGTQGTDGKFLTPNGVAVLGNGPSTFNLKPTTETLVNKEFEVFKLFNAENAIKGESINYTFNPKFEKALKVVVGKALNKNSASVTEYEVIDYMQGITDKPGNPEGATSPQQLQGRYSVMRYFIENVKDELAKENVNGDIVKVSQVKTDGSISITGLDYGYYLFDEVGVAPGEYSASSLCILNTINPNAEATIKSDLLNIIKKIKEDDNQNTIGLAKDGWNDIADYEIGQTVPYRFESNIPNIKGYKDYLYQWHDKMDAELTFHPESVEVIISDNAGKSYKLTKGEYEVITTGLTNGETFNVKVRDIKAIVDREFAVDPHNTNNNLENMVYGQKVTLLYTATLNDKAALDTGRPGFENTVRLEFSNDPDSDGVGKTGFTPWDTVVCFTYRLDVLKTNNHAAPLADAHFRLYSDKDCQNEVFVKKVNDTDYYVINRDLVGGADHLGGTTPQEATEMISNPNGVLNIIGLDSGVYYLKEVDSPAGYRELLDPIKLTVKAEFVANRDNYIPGDGATNKALVSLSADAHIKEFLSGIFTEDKSGPLVVDADAGKVNINVINTIGKQLPITGSNTVMISLVLGAGVVAVGGILLFKNNKTKKKKSSI